MALMEENIVFKPFQYPWAIEIAENVGQQVDRIAIGDAAEDECLACEG